MSDWLEAGIGFGYVLAILGTVAGVLIGAGAGWVHAPLTAEYGIIARIVTAILGASLGSTVGSVGGFVIGVVVCIIAGLTLFTINKVTP